MKILDAEAILSVPLRTTVVECKEWGGSVRIRRLTRFQMDEFASFRTAEDPKAVRYWLIAQAAIRNDGSPAFTTDQVKELGNRDWQAVDRLSDAILDFNGLTDKKIEDAGKN